MRRIGLAVVLILSLILAPIAAEAQEAGKLYRIAFLSAGSPRAPHLGVLRTALELAWIQALRDRGWVEGQNLVIDYRYAENRYDLLPVLAADLTLTKPDVMFVVGDQAIKAAKNATSTVPLVMIACDAVAAGLITSLARPGKPHGHHLHLQRDRWQADRATEGAPASARPGGSPLQSGRPRQGGGVARDRSARAAPRPSDASRAGP